MAYRAPWTPEVHFIIDAIAEGMVLRVPRDPHARCELIDIPRIRQTERRIVVEREHVIDVLAFRVLPYVLHEVEENSRRPHNRDSGCLGWRALGLEAEAESARLYWLTI